MKKDKFKIIEFMRKLIIYFDKILINFPKKELELKTILINELYYTLKLLYITNDMKKSDNKIDNKGQIISNIKFISFIIDRCYDKKIITNKEYLNIGYMLNNIMKYLNGWLKANI